MILCTFQQLSRTWDSSAFESGITVESNKQKAQDLFVLALRGVSPSINLDADESFKKAFEQYGIKKVTRVIKKRENRTLPIVRLELNDRETFNRIIKLGFRVECFQYKAEEWKYDNSQPLQCYKCLKYGHHQRSCTNEK